MRAIMSAFECIQEAKRCEHMAMLITDEELRITLREIALTWRKMAEMSPGAKYLDEVVRADSHC